MPEKITVYSYRASYCAQKVRIALYEKGIPFDIVEVDLTTGDNFQPWYMKLNPKAEVPTLKDEDFVLPDSAKILDYLENKYGSKNNYPGLIPTDPQELARMKQLRDLLLTVDIRLLTFGTVQYPELTQNRKVTKRDLNDFTGMQEVLLSKVNESESKNPELKELLQLKKKKFSTLIEILKDRNNVTRYLDSLEVMFDTFEAELSSHTGGKASYFLCSKVYNLADISLSALLNRLEMVGLETRYLSKRPHLQTYFQRIRERPSYKETFAFQKE